MPFIHTRTVRFQDTDAAGVVYFANVLAICHEAYEASLGAAGVNLKQFFSRGSIALPIVHASVDLEQPMFCGEAYTIHLTPKQLSPSKFSIQYTIFAADLQAQQVSQAATLHIAIQTQNRTRTTLPEEIQHWLYLWSAAPSTP